MATLQNIRNRGTLLLIVVGLALLAFILGDFVNSSSSYFSNANEDVVNVDGEGMKINEYQAEINQMEEVYKIEKNAQSLDENTTSQIRKSVYTEYVNNALLAEDAENIGLTITADELYNLLVGDNISPIISGRQMFVNPQTKQFDPAIVANFIQMIEQGNENIPADQLMKYRNYWQYFERFVKMNRLREKYNVGLTKGIVVNKLEAEDAFNSNNYKATAVFATKNYFAIPDSLVSQPTSSEIHALYNKKKAMFKQEANCDIKYVAFDIKPSNEDFAKADKWINELKSEFTTTSDIADLVNSNSDVTYTGTYFTNEEVDKDFTDFAKNENIGAIAGPIFVNNNTYKMARIVNKQMRPDSVKLRNIYVMAEDMQKTQALADSLETEIKKGASFAELAKQFSKAQNAENGGEIGMLSENGLDLDIATPAFTTPAGKCFQMKSSNGINLIQVEKVGKSIEKVQLAIMAREVTASSRTQAQLYNDAKRFASSNTTEMGLDTAATKLGLRLTPATNININAERVNNLSQARQIVKWAFENDPGTVSDVFECDNQLVVAIVSAIHNEEYKTIDEVEAMLKAEILNTKKADYIIKEMQGKSIEDLKAENFVVDTLKDMNFASRYAGGLGNEPKFMGLISNSKIGETSNLVQGNTSVFAIKVIDRVNENKTYNAKQEMVMLETQNSRMIPYMSIMILNDNAEITDNRHLFY